MYRRCKEGGVPMQLRGQQRGRQHVHDGHSRTALEHGVGGDTTTYRCGTWKVRQVGENHCEPHCRVRKASPRQQRATQGPLSW